MTRPWNDRLLNDDHTEIPVVRPSSYGYAQPLAGPPSRKRKRPLGFVAHQTKKPRRIRKPK
jgi:hypothetical protein